MILNFKKYIVKIPFYIEIFYCTNLKYIILKRNSKHLLLMRNIEKVMFNSKIKCVLITDKFKLNLLKKNLLNFCKIFKQLFFLKGIGFRVILIEINNYKILKFRLNFSHNIYLKLPENTNVIYFNFNKFCIVSYSKLNFNKIVSLIKSFKSLDVYKGKGILFENEIIKLKKVKKT